MSSFTDAKQDYLLKLLDELEDFVIAQHTFEQFSFGSAVDKNNPERTMKDAISKDVSDRFLTAFMLSLGFAVPSEELYQLKDYNEFIKLMGPKESDGTQLWNEG